jgi:hypothetical protein
MVLERKLGVEFIGTFFLVLTVGMAVATPEKFAPLAIGAVLMVRKSLHKRRLSTRVRGGAVLLILREMRGSPWRCRSLPLTSAIHSSAGWTI